MLLTSSWLNLKNILTLINNIVQKNDTSTGFSVILVSFQGDRTVLAHRGANAKIQEEDINFEAIKEADLVYIAPLNGDSNKVLQKIVDCAKANDTKICFNAGTTSIKKGFEHLKGILESAHIVVMNKEEASMTTGIEVRPDTKTEKFSEAESKAPSEEKTSSGSNPFSDDISLEPL